VAERPPRSRPPAISDRSRRSWLRPARPGPPAARLPRPGRTGPPARSDCPRPPWHRRSHRPGTPPTAGSGLVRRGPVDCTGRVGGWRGARLVPEFVSPRGKPAAGPFPSAPLRTERESFDLIRLSSTRKSREVRLWPFRRPCSLLFRSTCLASPCGRFSRPPTTIEAPSPWGSRPTGDLVLLRKDTSEPGLGRPLIPTPAEIRRSLTARACVTHNPEAAHAVTSRGVSLGAGLCISRSGLDFRRFRFGHARRVLRGDASLTSHVPRFSDMLWFPVPFGRG
jgi:hypothetical protein